MKNGRNERTMGTMQETLFKSKPFFFFKFNEIAHIDLCQHLVLTPNKPLIKVIKTTTIYFENLGGRLLDGRAEPAV
jgi:hypothetical protein